MVYQYSDVVYGRNSLFSNPTGNSYKWRILAYGVYGYGTWTPLMEFTLP